MWRTVITKHCRHRCNVRHYHAIKGLFGNYQPSFNNVAQQEDNVVQRKLSLLDSSLPLSYRLMKDAFQRNGYQLCHLNLLQQQQTEKVSIDTLLRNTTKINQLSAVLGVDLQHFINNSTTGTQSERQDYLAQLYAIYCGEIGFEFSQLLSLEELRWFEQQVAQLPTHSIDSDTIAKCLLETEALDHFLSKKFQSVKRYGCEGAETMVIFVEEIAKSVANTTDEPNTNNTELIVGMPHRGRLNLLVNTFQFPAEALFHKISGNAEFDLETGPGRTFAIGDVLSHLYTSVPFGTDHKPITITMLPNPSHLEVVAPVTCGYTRGKMMHYLYGPYEEEQSPKNGYRKQVPLQIHGDASFTGQGIIGETLAMANVDHYTVGGSVHLIVNNQIGYTTPSRQRQGRSSVHCTDPVKMINAPVIHVNGSRPELVIAAARLAVTYRQTFAKDIAVNLVCFRRWGHNELDDPTFTNPTMYQAINQQTSIPRLYAQHIQMSSDRVKEIVQTYNDRMNEALNKVNTFKPPPLSSLIDDKSCWAGIGWPSHQHVSKWSTAVSAETLTQIGQLSVTTPEDFALHQTLKRVFTDRLAKVQSNNTAGIDWATAEMLAFGSLLWQGFNVRISGQDVGRGTFSQRHAMVVDQQTDDVYIPLNAMNQSSAFVSPTNNNKKFGHIEVCNSILSEEAVMAFEYGLSLTSPNVLPIWEAQFGDFFNAAQPIIDTLVSSGEAKWLLQSALTLLLPHGYDGAGPDHTSARLERFLQLSDSSEVEVDSDQVNWSATFPTTPAQYFHLLRRQMIRPYRKPLVVMSPKMLLRHPKAVSTMAELSNATAHFEPVLDDPKYTKQHDTVNSVKNIIFCSGKHFYALDKEREDRAEKQHLPSSSIAIVRLEELCPFPVEALVNILRRYPNANNLIWSQEECRNMGAWSFVQPRFDNLLNRKLAYAGRGHLAAPAVGVGVMHQREIKQLFDDTFALCTH